MLGRTQFAGAGAGSLPRRDGEFVVRTERPATLPVPAAQRAAGRKNMNLLVQLRWIAVASQAVTILVVRFALGIALPLLPMALVLAALVALNLASMAWLRRQDDVGNGALSAALLLDTAALTVQLYLSGGITNPFVFLYLLQVTIAAVLLDAWMTWAVVALASASFAGLIYAYRPIHIPPALGGHLHIAGVFLCFLLDAALLVVFVTRIAHNLREHEDRIAMLKQHAAEEDHIVRMGLLASGAAHELGTPLSLLSVILGDWKRMPRFMADAELSREIEEMRMAVGRCKTIISGILLSAGEARGEQPGVTTLNGFFDGLVAEWRAARGGAMALTYRNEFGADRAIVSDTALKQVIVNVLDNAYEASPEHVLFSAGLAGDAIVLSVADSGPGFPPEMLGRLGRPYQSSKGRPGGGLGLFLVVNVVRKLGGTVSARNAPQGGAIVTITLPLAAFAVDEPAHAC